MLTHPSRRVVVIALSTLAMSLGMAFIPALFAQRVAQNQRRTESLKTLTLSGKGGTPSSAEPRAGSRPRPLTQAQKATLFKSRTVFNSNSFTLSPDKPVFSDKAWLTFKRPVRVDSSPDDSHAQLPGASNNTTNYVELRFRTKVGQLYALDYSVYGQQGRTFTIFNPNSGAAQTIPAEGTQHITAYVMAESELLVFWLVCTEGIWEFYSVEVTAL